MKTQAIKQVYLTHCGTVVNMSDEKGVIGSYVYEDWMENALPFNEWLDKNEAFKALGFEN